MPWSSMIAILAFGPAGKLELIERSALEVLSEPPASISPKDVGDCKQMWMSTLHPRRWLAELQGACRSAVQQSGPMAQSRHADHRSTSH